MNYELLALIRETGYLSDADLNAQQRYDLLTPRFWRAAEALGYNLPALRRALWVAAGRPEEKLAEALPEARIQKAARKAAEGKDTREKIKRTAEAVALLYLRGEKEIRKAIADHIEQPETLRAETGRIRRRLLSQAAAWLHVSVPGLYNEGAKVDYLQGPHAKAAKALLQQEFNRFKEVDAQIGRHVEEVIAEAEKRRTQAALAESRAKVNYAGLKDRIIGHKTIDGKELGLGDYIEMLAVSASRDFFNLGTQNGMISRKEDLAMISREVRSNSCSACRDWAGKTVSISGKTRGYPSLQDAIDANIFHPSCIHFLIPIDYTGST